jgi:hypothetical protein
VPSVRGRKRDLVRNRANGACEYCRIAEEAVLPAVTAFQVEHIIPQARFPPGSAAVDDLSNLAWSCPRCNSFKRSAVQGRDLKSGEYSRLFHPRQDRWLDHFVALPSGHILGLTAVGRVTVMVLRFNDDADAVTGRVNYHLHGWWPVLD